MREEPRCRKVGPINGKRCTFAAAHGGPCSNDPRFQMLVDPEAAGIFEETYSMAAECTGKSVGQLKLMAYQVFSTMLYHSLLRPETPVYTVHVVGPKKLEVEVNFRPRNLRSMEVPAS